MGELSKELKVETNSAAYKRQRKISISKKTGQCNFCPPHAGENATRTPAHKSWKDATHRSVQHA